MKLAWEIAFLVMMLIVAVILMGCGSSLKSGSDVIDKLPTDGVQALWRVVVKTDWVTTACLIGVVIGIFAFLNGQKVGLAIVGACSAGLFMGMAMHRFATWFAVCGLIGSIASGLASVLANKKAMAQLVQGIQNIKNTDVAWLTIHKSKINGIMSDAQDKDTMKKVIETKAALKIKEVKNV